MKKIRNFFLYISFGVAGATLLAACKKFIEIPPPTTLVTTPTIFNNNATATSATLNIYNSMANSNADSYFIANTTGLLADELTNYSSYKPYTEYYTNALNSVDITGKGTALGCWSDAYNYIYQSNAIISGLQTINGVTPAVKQQLTGEAYFIRAFWHFNLANEYGDVPLALTTDYTVTSLLPRTAQKLVYQQCINDLKTAEGMLNVNYVDATDTAVTTERVRPNKAAADALLAKIYLFIGDYQNAKTEASAVINNTALYSLAADPNNVFLANSSETIFQLQAASPLINNGATNDGQNFILTNSPTNASNHNSSAISPQLLAAFETGDTRRMKWISAITKGGTTYNFPFKYKYNSNNAGGTVREYTMVLRLAEQYLIRAEAEANLSDMVDAANDLNIIRNRAGLPPSPVLTATATLGQALTAILHERQVELFTEWGNRWFDLRRTGTINAIMGAVAPFKSTVWDSHDALFPIPFGEMTNNPNLIQNIGY